MNKFVTVDNTRSVPSGKTYNRKKEKKRAGREFRDGFGAGSFVASLMTTISPP